MIFFIGISFKIGRLIRSSAAGHEADSNNQIRGR
jgi:hypothetical protein